MIPIADTTVFCPKCQSSHPGRIARDGHRILGFSGCPASPPPVELSDDANLFLLQRQRDHAPAGPSPDPLRRFQSRHLYITKDCNCRCPVCYRSATPDSPSSHLPFTEIVRRATHARQLGFRTVLLIGGEPTVHPEILDVIREIHRLGFSVAMATNGWAIGTSSTLAAQLKQAGLTRISIQFDTLDRKTLLRLRGHDRLDVKLRAIQQVTEAGIPFFLAATMAKLNLAETGALLHWAESLPVLPLMFLFQSMIPFGRFPADLDSVSREAIIRSVLDSGAIAGATSEHIHPIPSFPPAHLAVHPDCGSILFAMRRKGRFVPADSAIDVVGLTQDAAAVPANRSRIGIWRDLVRHGWRRSRPECRLELARAIAGPLFSRPNRRLMMVGFTSFCQPGFIDEQRIARCGSGILAGSDPESVCSYFARQLSSDGALPCTSP